MKPLEIEGHIFWSLSSKKFMNNDNSFKIQFD